MTAWWKDVVRNVRFIEKHPLQTRGEFFPLSAQPGAVCAPNSTGRLYVCASYGKYASHVNRHAGNHLRYFSA